MPLSPWHFRTTLLALFVCLAACDDPKAEDWSSDLADELASSFVPISRLSFGGEVFGEFTQEDQLDAYRFSADKGATLTLDNSNLGTSRHLDSTLFVYGPQDANGSYGTVAMAFNDDGGWGTHARIKNLTLTERGEYLAVIGTFAGADRGRYRLAMSCSGDTCTIPCDESCGQEDMCSGQTCDLVDGCIAQEAPQQCSLIEVSRSHLATSAEGSSDSFTVRLQEVPTDNVIVRIQSSDPDQATVYPQWINFCKPGFHEQSNGCESIAADAAIGPESWSQQVQVQVRGVRSLVPDGDSLFTISFQVETGDERYAALSLPSLEGINIGDSPAPTLDGMSTLRDDELISALFSLTSDHQSYGYRGQNNARDLMFSVIDVHEGRVEGLYRGGSISKPQDAIRAFQAGFNTEHTWPQAQFDKVEPAVSDLHHVFPVDIDTNGKRSSFDYGITSPNSSLSRLGTRFEGSGTVFQVRPNRRGDVARAHFYLVARYQLDTTLGVDQDTPEGITFDDDRSLLNGSIKNSEEDVLRAWHEADPVDDLERLRNNRIEGFQGNRNPFIDRPSLVDQIADF